MYELKNTKRVELSDKVRFRCKRCAECCTHVKAIVALEVKDAYYLAKYLNISVSEFYDEYADMYFLEDTGFPMFTLKSVGSDNKCIFLKGKRCSVQEAKPKTCRMYPFFAFPECDGEYIYTLSTERRHHPKGSLIRVKDWMKENFTDEDKKFIEEEARVLPELGRLWKNAPDKKEAATRTLMLRYFMYETDKPFFEQFCHNNKLLKKELKILANERNEKK